MKLIPYFFLFFPFLAFAGPMQEIRSKSEFAAYLEESQFNGVLLVEKGEDTLWRKAYGYRDFESKDLIQISDKFQIGSVTKQFTAAAILKLQEMGKLSLDDSLGKHIPGFSQEITIRDILNHSAGIKNYTEAKEFWDLVNPAIDMPLKSIVHFILGLGVDFAPRTKYSYSNSGYILAGEIVESISGSSWDNFIDSNFLRPLGMINSGYVSRFETVSPVKAYSRNEKGVVEPVGAFNLSWAQPAGGLYSTVDDLAKWTAIYTDSPLLSAESKKLMQTPFLKNYALGVTVTDLGGDTQIAHGGRTPGFVTNLTYRKNAKLKVINVDNTDGGNLELGSLAVRFFTEGRALALKVKDFSADISRFPEFLGAYKNKNGNMIFTITQKDDALYLQPNDGQPAYRLFPNDVDSFRLEGFAGEEFLRNEQGLVIGLNHYQGGKVTEFIKQ